MSEDQPIAELIAKAVQPFQDRISSLERTVAMQSEKIAALEATASHQTENQEIQLRLICQLREATRKEPQPTQKDRADVLRALLVANGGKILAKDARQKMHLRKDLFSQLLTSCNFIEVKPLHSDKRKHIIILRSELV